CLRWDACSPWAEACLVGSGHPQYATVQGRFIVVGGGIAGLATVLRLTLLSVTLLVASPLGREASTPLAQGGIAAAIGPDDNPALHAADTVNAGAGLSDPAVAERIAAAAPSCIEWLIDQGVSFDRTASGAKLLL